MRIRKENESPSQISLLDELACILLYQNFSDKNVGKKVKIF